jgi:hypothetical protein
MNNHAHKFAKLEEMDQFPEKQSAKTLIKRNRKSV